MERIEVDTVDKLCRVLGCGVGDLYVIVESDSEQN